MTFSDYIKMDYNDPGNAVNYQWLVGWTQVPNAAASKNEKAPFYGRKSGDSNQWSSRRLPKKGDCLILVLLGHKRRISGDNLLFNTLFTSPTQKMIAVPAYLCWDPLFFCFRVTALQPWPERFYEPQQSQLAKTLGKTMPSTWEPVRYLVQVS